MSVVSLCNVKIQFGNTSTHHTHSLLGFYA